MSVAAAPSGTGQTPAGPESSQAPVRPRGHGPVASPFRQPKAVWAVAFACVVSFMGIGLVDPILPSLAGKLHATPAPGRAPVHQLSRGHRRGDAGHRLGEQQDRA